MDTPIGDVCLNACVGDDSPWAKDMSDVSEADSLSHSGTTRATVVSLYSTLFIHLPSRV